jgi:trk system potassium uptake protein TrkA
MRAVIMGCGRVGSTLALMLDAEGHEVSVVDMDSGAFRRLGEHFGGRTISGIGINADVLRAAGIEGADTFIAVTNGDNSNIMASQIAKVRFKIPRVMARIYDPLRAEVYREVGIETLCITVLGAGILYDRLFNRPYEGIEEYWSLTHQVHKLYAADLPTPDQLAKQRAEAKGKHRNYVLIAGGGKVGYQLGRTLIQKGEEVLVLEKRPQRYQLLHDELGENVFFGDACEIRTMVRVGMERADLVVAVTGDDEDNLVICQVAKRWFGVPRAIGRVNNPHNEEIFRVLGVDETISTTRLMFQLIEQEVSTRELVPLSLLRKGDLEVVEVELPASSPALRKPVKKLNLPHGCLLAACVRGNSSQVVTGDTVLREKDRVVALTEPGSVAALRQALLGG